MDWWQEVEDNWPDLVGCIERFHPVNRNEEDLMEFPISAEMPEKFSKVIRKQIADEQTEGLRFKKRNVVQEAEVAKGNRDGATLHTIFNQTWFGAPESRDVFSVPGFGLLCDLCSEYEGE